MHVITISDVKLFNGLAYCYLVACCKKKKNKKSRFFFLLLKNVGQFTWLKASLEPNVVRDFCLSVIFKDVSKWKYKFSHVYYESYTEKNALFLNSVSLFFLGVASFFWKFKLSRKYIYLSNSIVETTFADRYMLVHFIN